MGESTIRIATIGLPITAWAKTVQRRCSKCGRPVRSTLHRMKRPAWCSACRKRRLPSARSMKSYLWGRLPAGCWIISAPPEWSQVAPGVGREQSRCDTTLRGFPRSSNRTSANTAGWITHCAVSSINAPAISDLTFGRGLRRPPQRSTRQPPATRPGDPCRRRHRRCDAQFRNGDGKPFAPP